MTFSRSCPDCHAIIISKGWYNYKQSVIKNRVCKKCCGKHRKELYSGINNPFYGKKHTTETKSKIREVNRNYTKTVEFSNSVKNGMKGNTNRLSNYECWVKKYGKEEADQKLKDASLKKSKKSSGSNNPMYGKPSPKGSGNGWSGWYSGIFFRSLRELSYLVYLKENNIKFKTLENKEHAIEYVDYEGRKRKYFPDFMLIDLNEVVEIKPKRLWNTPTVVAKKDAALKHYSALGISYYLYDPIVDILKIKMLVESGQIEFVERYKEKYESWVKSN